MHTVALPNQEAVPALGLGTWRMGENRRSRADEVAALRLALEMGYRLIDTAEMYGEGGAEEVVGQALAEAQRAGTVERDQVFVVSKVYPHNASRQGVLDACERSRKRLQLDRLDLYLLHWRGRHPLAETVAGFAELQSRGRVRHWGVSNFDVDDLDELGTVPGGDACASNQVYYALAERGPEFELLPAMRRVSMPLMAYSPIAQGALAGEARLGELAARHSVSPAQLALAWVLAQPGVIAIPKAARESHLRDNLAAAALRLDDADRSALDGIFPPPATKRPLAMI